MATPWKGPVPLLTNQGSRFVPGLDGEMGDDGLMIPGSGGSGGTISFGTPGSSNTGDSIAAGVATTAARSDHQHGREQLAMTCRAPTANQIIPANFDVICLDSFIPAAGVSVLGQAGARFIGTISQVLSPSPQPVLVDLSINPVWKYWQNLGPTTGTVNLGVVGTAENYFADQWKGAVTTGTTVAPIQVTASPHWAATYLSLLNTGSAGKMAIWQPMEDWSSKFLSNANTLITLSVWAKISSGTPNLKIGLVEFTGTANSLGGNGGTTLISSWSTTTGSDPVFKTVNGYSLNPTTGSIALSTSWQQLQVTIRVNPGKNNIIPFIWLDSTTISQVVSISEFSCVPSIPVPIPANIINDFRRYYSKSYELDTVPGTATNNGRDGGAVSSGDGNNAMSYGVTFPVPMRATPSISYWDTAGNTSKIAFVTASGTTLTSNQTATVGPQVISTTTFTMTSNTIAVAAGSGLIFHHVADARM